MTILRTCFLGLAVLAGSAAVASEPTVPAPTSPQAGAQTEQRARRSPQPEMLICRSVAIPGQHSEMAFVCTTVADPRRDRS